MSNKIKIVFASKNNGKTREAQALLADTGFELVPLSAYENIPDIVEDGDTFFANAYKKAKGIAELTGEMALADDSGLEVAFLAGSPGVHSARYAGEDASDEDNMRKLLTTLDGVPQAQRGAAFVCCLVLYKTPIEFTAFEGRLTGEICEQAHGNSGFGYDPVFFLPHRKLTAAQLSLDEKNKISHRAQAFAKLKAYLLK